MRVVLIRENEAGQRLDKYLHKYMKEAPGSFFYKMMRKKNIVLNGEKCSGNEKLAAGDELKLFMSEETLEKFGAPAGPAEEGKAFLPSARRREVMNRVDIYRKTFFSVGPLPVIYEDRSILAVSKPAGLLTQKSGQEDISLNEWLIGYLLDEGALTDGELITFRPSVCNRLDRNTSGLVLCAKTLAGAQFLSEALREKRVHKYYRLFVKGWMENAMLLEDGLIRDSAKNQVTIVKKPEEKRAGQTVLPVKTQVTPLQAGILSGCGPVTYVEAELFTGKSHQIRAQLSACGHPLLGDRKYGDPALNRQCRKYGIHNQLLHAYRVRFDDAVPAAFASVAGRELIAGQPDVFDTILEKIRDGI